jgi:translation initiation factor 2 gamma subunit (eIF-2gamma)
MKIITQKKLIPDKNIVIVGNKLDLCLKDTNARKISQEEAKGFAKSEGAKYLEVSADTGHNVDHIFELITSDLL